MSARGQGSRAYEITKAHFASPSGTHTQQARIRHIYAYVGKAYISCVFVCGEQDSREMVEGESQRKESPCGPSGPCGLGLYRPGPHGMGPDGPDPYGPLPYGPPGLLWAVPLWAERLWASLGPYGPGPHGPPCALVGMALVGQAIMGRALVGFALLPPLSQLS